MTAPLETHLFIGSIKPLPPEGQSTGIFKEPLLEPAAIGPLGIAGDRQADLRVHGGPDKAVHQYCADHYPPLAAAFPRAAAPFVPGSLGENLSVAGLDETTVCIGDRFRLGTALLEVSQPRSPCWKIDARFGIASGRSGLAYHIAQQSLTGWYYRVVEAGTVRPGDVLEQVGEGAGHITLAALWNGWHCLPAGSADPSPAWLRQVLATVPALPASWQKKLAERATWLEANRPSADQQPSTPPESSGGTPPLWHDRPH